MSWQVSREVVAKGYCVVYVHDRLRDVRVHLLVLFFKVGTVFLNVEDIHSYSCL